MSYIRIDEAKFSSLVEIRALLVRVRLGRLEVDAAAAAEDDAVTPSCITASVGNLSTKCNVPLSKDVMLDRFSEQVSAKQAEHRGGSSVHVKADRGLDLSEEEKEIWLSPATTIISC